MGRQPAAGASHGDVLTMADALANQVHLRFGAGVDNRSRASQLESGYALAIDNIDIDKNGVLTPREGHSLAVALAGAHSVKAFESFPFALVADASSLYLLNSAFQLTALRAGLNGTAVHYAQLGSSVFWSNGVQTGIVRSDGSAHEWGIETPLPTFTAAAAPTGGLFAGGYAVTATFVNANGEEGGAPEPVYVDVPEGGGILVSGIPRPLSGEPSAMRLYVTEANSPDLLFAQSIPVNSAQWLLGAQMLGRPLTTLLKAKMPAAKWLLAKAGRIFGVVDNRVVWTDPLYYGLTDLANNYLKYPQPPTMLAAPDLASFIVYVATREKVYRLDGDSISTASQSVANSKGAIPGSMVMVPPDAMQLDRVEAPVPVWVGADGIPYAGTGFGVVALSNKFVYPLYDEATSIFAQRNGANRWLVGGKGGKRSGLAMSDQLDGWQT